MSGAWHDYNLVFCTPIGTPIDARNLLREFKALLERTELPNMRLHDLRHSSATLLIAKGVHPRVVDGSSWSLADQYHDEHVWTRYSGSAAHCVAGNGWLIFGGQK